MINNHRRSSFCILPMALAGILLAAACGSPSMHGDEETPTASVELAPQFDGEDILRGVLFGQGPVATRIPEHAKALEEALFRPQTIPVKTIAAQLHQHAAQLEKAGALSEQVARIRERASELERSPDTLVTSAVTKDVLLARADALIARIRQAHPSFFQQFAIEMQSGDRVRIDAALKRANETMSTAAKDLAATRQSTLAPPSDDVRSSPYWKGESIMISSAGFIDSSVAAAFDFDLSPAYVIVAVPFTFFAASGPNQQEPSLARDTFVSELAMRLKSS